MDSPELPKVINGINSDRIVALSNSVFGTVPILLVLEIKPPQAQSEAELIRQLLDLWPNFLSFVISFVTSGIFWFGHYMEFHYIRRSDRMHIWLTLAFLMCIAFFPFSAILLAGNLHYRTAIAILVSIWPLLVFGVTSTGGMQPTGIDWWMSIWTCG